jgi:ribonuclease HI
MLNILEYKYNNMSIIVFTDGSFVKSKNNIKCGYGIHFPNAEFEDESKLFDKPPLTNQRAELYAIHEAIRIISTKDNKLNIDIYTDSEYSIKSLTEWIKNWKKNSWVASTGKPVLNKDIIEEIDKLILNHNGKIKFHHVRAHTNNTDYESIHNDITDRLAKNAKI